MRSAGGDALLRGLSLSSCNSVRVSTRRERKPGQPLYKSKVRIGREQAGIVFDGLGCNPYIIRRDRLASLAKTGEELSEEFRGRERQGYDLNLGITEKFFEELSILLIPRTVVKSIQKLSQDDGGDHHFFRLSEAPDNLRPALHHRRIGVRIEKDPHDQRDSSISSNTSIAFENSAASSADQTPKKRSKEFPMTPG